jgi:diketogulonate reductase-like aldo/keto reductase
MQHTISGKIKLNNGTEIPLFGFGTYQIRGHAAKESVLSALEAGYRHIDTAAAYGNEKETGQAIKESGVSRNQIFVTTKLWNEDQGYDSAFEAFENSLESLDTNYIDLYLLHWPVTGKRIESWKALEKIAASGRCHAIGVSNFTIPHLEELLENCKITPAINQVEFNPFLYQKDLWDYCRTNNITLEAYTPLSRGKKLDHPVLRDLSGRYHKTPAQIILRWFIEHEIIVIPKSSNKKRIIENSQIFDFTISQQDMKKLDSLNEGFRVAWDPSTIK